MQGSFFKLNEVSVICKDLRYEALKKRKRSVMLIQDKKGTKNQLVDKILLETISYSRRQWPEPG